MNTPTVGKKMKAAVLYSAEDLRYESVPVPQVRDDEVLVRIQTNGLCGSDIHFYEDGELGPFRVDQPYVPGHEAVGVVVRSNIVGPRRAIGQRVVVEPGIPCRRCEYCKSGRYNLCNDVVFLSAPPINGTFAEFVAIPADLAHPVPDNLSHEMAALVEPVSVALQACVRSGITAGDTVAVLGVGPIGLITFLVARSYGATRIYLVDIQDNRLDIGLKLGATAALHAEKTDITSEIADLTNGRGVDVVFDTSGSSIASKSAPGLARRGGIVCLVGWPEIGEFAYPIESIIEKELDVRGVNRYCNTFPRAIDLLAVGDLDLQPLVSHRFPFKDVTEAFHFASANRSETIKILVSSEY